MTETIKPIGQGHLNKITINIDNPIPLKEIEMEVREIMLLVGQNGSGKTFVLCTTWCLAYIICNIVLGKLDKIPGAMEAAAQFCIDNSLNCGETTGTLGGEYENCSISIHMVDGKVTKVDFNQGKVTQPVPAVYMSSEMRLFKPMEIYARQREMLMPIMSNEKRIEAMLKSYKLYDILALESFMLKLPLNITMDTKSYLAGFDFPDDDLMTLEFDEGGFFVTVIKDEKKRYVTSHYGSGHQALLNMGVTLQR